jgi:hypothetical protein
MGKRATLSTKSKIERAKKICELYSMGEYTISSCCDALEVKYETFKQWAQPNLTKEDIQKGNYRPGFIPAIHSLYKRALENNNVNYKVLLKDTVRMGILKRANGITYTETETIARYDEDGKQAGIIVRKNEKVILPDTGLLIFLAKCLGLFDCQSESNREFIGTLKSQFEHLTTKELQAKRLELEEELINEE